MTNRRRSGSAGTRTRSTAARRAAEQRRRAAEQRRRRIQLLIGLGAAALVVAVLVVAVNRGPATEGPDQASTEPMGEAIPLLGNTHVPEGTPVEYNSNPPTSGDHWPEPAGWGVYDEPLPDEVLVHNIEHGGIWISYTGLDKADVAGLAATAEQYPEAVIVTPRPRNDSPIALASWGRLLKLDSVDDALIAKFIRANVNQSPEKLASISQPQVRVGGGFPEFLLTETTAGSGGREITLGTLRGRPSIVWFTTSYCVPCQVGAERVARLDDQLGGDAFDVLVVFLDSNEPVDDLLGWKKNFAREDWLVAYDTDKLLQRAEVRVLDYKLLLDAQGTIVNIDVNEANDAYLDLIRETVGRA